jgi:uncharacterized membrane protein YeaQ/YmgE (transglycosylase-associated protein family)
MSRFGPGMCAGPGFRGAGRYFMDGYGILATLLIGAIAGWLAGVIVAGGGFGLIGNIVLGILGAFVAGWILPKLGLYIGGGVIGAIINAAIGAAIILVVISLIKRA